MRRGFDGLSADGAQVLKADPFSGAVFVFRGKRGDYLKILTWDGSGLCLFAKRLDNGKFVWPPIVDGPLKLTPAQLEGDRLASHGRPGAPEQRSFV
jgi:transposase